ncbi:MAG TPA: hypothetical protein ENI62_14990 [Gammaproteobacteria bacterium]|nr:hypothetical protein [Gammaproteobacteria bacterium]
MPTKVEKVGRHGNMNPVMPVFALLSLLGHLLILISLTNIAATPQSDKKLHDNDFLSVRIYRRMALT